MLRFNTQASYFGTGDVFRPWRILDRWLNPFRHSRVIDLNGKPLRAIWTARAGERLAARPHTLIAEMQLYFSCVVKKRVLFHDEPDMDSQTRGELDTRAVTDRLSVAFRPVEARSCDPEEFAANYPVKRQFTSLPACKMRPAELKLDYRRGAWWGEFTC